MYWEKLKAVVDNEVVKKHKINTLKAKVNNLEKKIPDATTLIHINQYKTEKKKLREENWRYWEKNIRWKRLSDYNWFEYQNYLSWEQHTRY